MTDHNDPSFCDVVCIATGSKVIRPSNLKSGDNIDESRVADSHAEILVRRCFINYIYDQIDKVDNGCSIISRSTNTESTIQYRIKSNIKVNLFIPSAPCGGCRVFTKGGQIVDNNPEKVNRNKLRVKLFGGVGNTFARANDRFQVKSCSDKIALWNVVGIQGALLSKLIEPIYLDTIVINQVFSYDFMTRSLNNRFSQIGTELTLPYRLNKINIENSTDPFESPKFKKVKNAINWIKDYPVEVVAIHEGLVHMIGESSRLSRANLFEKFNKVFPNCSSYQTMKLSAHDYQINKNKFIVSMDPKLFGPWIKTGEQSDEFHR